jgi:hypothetical protein
MHLIVGPNGAGKTCSRGGSDRSGWMKRICSTRYVNISLNHVRAKLVQKAQYWRWSSVAAHVSGMDDNLVKVAPILERFGDFAALFGSLEDETASDSLRQSEATGRPLRSEHWIEQLDQLTGSALKPQKCGPTKSELGVKSVFGKLSP